MSRFSQKYDKVSRVGSGGIPRVSPNLACDGFAEFLDAYHGCEFNSGVYRVRDSDSVKVFDSVLEMHSGWSDRVIPFGFDWLGRQFALDLAEIQGGKEPSVVIFEPGTGEVLEAPCTFQEFHEVELIEHADAALADDFFLEWVANSGGGVGWRKCAGYRVPLFLGGFDSVENLEESDTDVYWSICAQLWSGTR
ncbi:hypothetical protein QMK19_26880 [Streptomyces sp. H10-C2]|uniref:hypothetical protein n=1 Tax=unclassified Streptomyces TaxID=2593676 RepID=UPI0024BA471B|nr:MULTISPECIES: hypothetical protein [unclassified Streptomyces]MDJ0344660.1 hypothetical protein [Streptomyces sp. PH10-H1]MDJ0373180.1 hypothetical protein [Streptomyces sp. H10-C2]